VGFWRNKYVLIFLTLTVILIVFIIFSASHQGSTGLAENGIGTVFSATNNFFGSIGGGIHSFFDYFASKQAMLKENSELLQSQDELRNEMRRYQSYIVENSELRQLLELKKNITEYDTISAEIVSRNISNWHNTFIVDKGSADGVEHKMSVVAYGGIVGYVSDVGLNWARVITIINPEISVSGVSARTGDIYIVSGDVSLQRRGLCKMSFIDREADLLPGDAVLSSGLGGVFEKGFVIGVVKEKEIDPNSIDQTAIIEPAVDFSKMSKVLLVKKRVDIETAE